MPTIDVHFHRKLTISVLTIWAYRKLPILALTTDLPKERTLNIIVLTNMIREKTYTQWGDLLKKPFAPVPQTRIPLFLLLLFIGFPLAKLYASEGETERYPDLRTPFRPGMQRSLPVTDDSISGKTIMSKKGKRGAEEKMMKDPVYSDRVPPKDTGSTLKKERSFVPQDDSVGVLVNKDRALPVEYIPQDLVVPNIPFSFSEDLPKKKMRKEAAHAVERLFAQAERDGLQLTGVSAYRSYQRQQEIFDRNSKIKGEAEANKVSARPGESEHQTGLAIDVSAPSVNYQLVEAFGETKEGKWLRENAHKYGFIIRYPEGKEKTTGYQYEPWHLRYVGQKAAWTITTKGLTLEEYIST